MVSSLPNSGHFLAIYSDPKAFENGNIIFGYPKEFDDPQVSDDLKFISNESMDFNDPKEFDDHQVFKDPKGISIGSMDFDNPKVYGNTPIFDGLVVHGIFMICKVTVCLPVHL